MDKQHTLFLCIACAICWLSQASASTTLFEENFSGNRTDPLNGTTPNISTSSWAAAANFNADGSTKAGSEGSALLAFSPNDDSVYTLTVTMNKPKGGWAMFGFCQNGVISTSLWKNNPEKVGPIMLWRSKGLVESYLGAGGAKKPGLGGKKKHGKHNQESIELGIVIDKTIRDKWRIDYLINGSIVRTETNFSLPSSLSYVGISQSNFTTNDFASFKLIQSSSIPEPEH